MKKSTQKKNRNKCRDRSFNLTFINYYKLDYLY